MRVIIPNHLKDKDISYLYQLMAATFQRGRKSQTTPVAEMCSKRPYDMTVCRGEERNGVRYGTFERCKWYQLHCHRGEFFSRPLSIAGKLYEFRVGRVLEGEHESQYGTAVLDVNDTQFKSQGFHQWQMIKGSPELMQLALAVACIPKYVPFSRNRTIQAEPSDAVETIQSTTIIESGVQTFCDTTLPVDIAQWLEELPVDRWWEHAKTAALSMIQAFALLTAKTMTVAQAR